GAPGQLDYGKKILLPHIDRHLAVAFFGAQLAATLVAAALLPRVARWLELGFPGEPAPRGRARATKAIRPALVRALGLQRRGLEAAFELIRTGDRAHASAAE